MVKRWNARDPSPWSLTIGLCHMGVESRRGVKEQGAADISDSATTTLLSQRTDPKLLTSSMEGDY